MPQSGVAAAAAISLVWARVVVVVVVDAIKVSYIFVKLLIIYFLWTGHVGAVAKSFLFNRPDRNINTFLDYNVIIIIMMMIKTHRVLRCRCSRHRVRCCVIRRNYPVTSALFSLPPRRSRVDKQSVSRHVAIFRTRPQRVGKGGGDRFDESKFVKNQFQRKSLMESGAPPVGFFISYDFVLSDIPSPRWKLNFESLNSPLLLPSRLNFKSTSLRFLFSFRFRSVEIRLI